MEQEFYDALAAQQDFFARMHEREMRKIEMACRAPASRRSLPVTVIEPSLRLATVDGKRVPATRRAQRA